MPSRRWSARPLLLLARLASAALARLASDAGLHNVTLGIGGRQRYFQLFVPRSYGPGVDTPLWLLAPGTSDAPETLLAQTGLLRFAEERGFAFAALAGVHGNLNVALHALEDPEWPDDVEYTRAVLREVGAGSESLAIDLSRVRCVGFSRGARFCSRLASQLSNFVSGVAAVGGVRYPEPNNATRSVPILAIHGTADAINPLSSAGDQRYWNSSVASALRRWGRFNRCNASSSEVSPGVITVTHSDCDGGADVVFMRIAGGGHTWPGSSFKYGAKCGKTSHAVNANEVIHKFFQEHSRRDGSCGTPKPGSDCREHVDWVMQRAIFTNPEYYPGLTPNSTFEEFQMMCHQRVYADCPKPCEWKVRRTQDDPTPKIVGYVDPVPDRDHEANPMHLPSGRCTGRACRFSRRELDALSQGARSAAASLWAAWLGAGRSEGSSGLWLLLGWALVASVALRCCFAVECKKTTVRGKQGTLVLLQSEEDAEDSCAGEALLRGDAESDDEEPPASPPALRRSFHQLKSMWTAR